MVLGELQRTLCCSHSHLKVVKSEDVMSAVDYNVRQEKVCRNSEDSHGGILSGAERQGHPNKKNTLLL